MNRMIRTLLFLTLSPISFGSHWGSVFVPEITLNHPEAKVTVRVGPKSAKLEALEVAFGKKKVSLPKSELIGIEQVDIQSVRIVTSYGPGKVESRSPLTDTLIIALEFGPEKYHTDEELERIISVRSVVHFIFDSSEYTRRLIAKPKKNFKNKWNLFEKENGMKEVDDGTEEQVKSPY